MGGDTGFDDRVNPLACAVELWCRKGPLPNIKGSASRNLCTDPNDFNCQLGYGDVNYDFMDERCGGDDGKTSTYGDGLKQIKNLGGTFYVYDEAMPPRCWDTSELKALNRQGANPDPFTKASRLHNELQTGYQIKQNNKPHPTPNWPTCPAIDINAWQTSSVSAPGG